MRRPNLTSLRTRWFLSVLLGAIGVAAITVLAANVVRDLRLLNTATSDNVQWTLSQTEVEFLEFERNLLDVNLSEKPDLKILRREFDVFYSRIKTLREASIYAPVRYLPEFSANLETLQNFLDQSVGFIDDTDVALIAALPKLIDDAAEIRSSVRRLSNSGLNYFARESDRRRENVSVTLNQLALGVTVLMVALLLLALYLGRLNRLNIKRSREAIQASERMNIVTSTALDAVVVVDTDGQVLDFNAAAEQIFGYRAKEAIGNALDALIVPEQYLDAHRAGMSRMREGGEKRVVGKGRIRLEAKRKTGEVFPVEFAIQSAETDDGEIFVSFLRDISHRVAAEQELVSARDKALAGEKAKTDFLATMSHEIRTPLNGLLGNLTLLEDTGLSAKQQRYVKNMDTSGKLLMSHISNVLDITKYDAGKLQLRPVDMNISSLLQDIIDNQSGAALANNTSLRWGWVGPAVHWIHCDRERLQHVLMNVIGNAVKFSANGQVSVEIAAIQNKQGPVLQIDVQDTGIGISPELTKQIFGDFLTGNNAYDRDVGGTGLGLGIARRFIRALGGSIEVESIEGDGSTFSIVLPVTQIDAPEIVQEQNDVEGGSDTLNILLVEDNEINRFVTREMLIAHGHNVSDAHNGKIAVEMASGQHFDLILMDISMPVMDGRVATRAIRAGDGLSADTPIVALTANAMAEEQEAFLADGMNNILTKPLSRDGLNKMLAYVGKEAVRTDLPAPAEEANQHIAELRETLGDAGARAIVRSFLQEAEEAITFFQTDPLESFDHISSRAHQLSGSAATVGAISFRAALIELIAAAKQNDRKAVTEAINSLKLPWGADQDIIDRQ